MRDPSSGAENLVNMQAPDLAVSLSEMMLPRGQHFHGYFEFYVATPFPLSTAKIKAELNLTDALSTVHHSGEQEIWYIGEGWRGGNVGQAHKSPGAYE
jgi:hypothetical protein